HARGGGDTGTGARTEAATTCRDRDHRSGHGRGVIAVAGWAGVRSAHDAGAAEGHHEAAVLGERPVQFAAVGVAARAVAGVVGPELVGPVVVPDDPVVATAVAGDVAPEDRGAAVEVEVPLGAADADVLRD